MDMQEFERNRRKKKENPVVDHVNVNTLINKRDFINYNPLLSKANIENNSTEDASEHEGALKTEGTFRNEGATKIGGTTRTESASRKEGTVRSEGTTKMGAPQKIKIDLNCIERTKVTLDSLRFEQIVKHIIAESNMAEVVIGRRVFENNGVNKGRFTQAREETKDRGILEFGKKYDENGIEYTWYKLK